MWHLRPGELWEHLGGVKGHWETEEGEFSPGYTYEGQADRTISSGEQLSEI